MRIMVMLFAAALLWGCGRGEAPQTPATSPGVFLATSGPVVENAWVRQVPPAARMTAGYLQIHNPGDEPLVIVGAESALFQSIEVHGTVMADGVARMRQQDAVTVPPGETVNFEPGGLHLMLMQPVNGIPESGTIELRLVLEDGQRLDFNASIGQPAD
jgi:periplasmic copper chaperone A